MVVISRAILGEEDPDTLITMSNVVTIYSDQRVDNAAADKVVIDLESGVDVAI